MAAPFDDMVDRVVALERACMRALNTPVNVDATKQFFRPYTGTVLFTNRLAPLTIESESEDIDLITIDLKMRLIIGHITQGYEGDNEANLYTYIPHVLEYFNERPLLVDTAFPTHIDHLIEARLIDGLGFAVFTQGGFPNSQVGTEFTLRTRWEQELIVPYN